MLKTHLNQRDHEQHFVRLLLAFIQSQNHKPQAVAEAHAKAVVSKPTGTAVEQHS